jgi:hypothetical protein
MSGSRTDRLYRVSVFQTFTDVDCDEITGRETAVDFKFAAQDARYDGSWKEGCPGLAVRNQQVVGSNPTGGSSKPKGPVRVRPENR